MKKLFTILLFLIVTVCKDSAAQFKISDLTPTNSIHPGTILEVSVPVSGGYVTRRIALTNLIEFLSTNNIANTGLAGITVNAVNGVPVSVILSNTNGSGTDYILFSFPNSTGWKINTTSNTFAISDASGSRVLFSGTPTSINFVQAATFNGAAQFLNAVTFFGDAGGPGLFANLPNMTNGFNFGELFISSTATKTPGIVFTNNLGSPANVTPFVFWFQNGQEMLQRARSNSMSFEHWDGVTLQSWLRISNGVVTIPGSLTVTGQGTFGTVGATDGSFAGAVGISGDLTLDNSVLPETDNSGAVGASGQRFASIYGVNISAVNFSAENASFSSVTITNLTTNYPHATAATLDCGFWVSADVTNATSANVALTLANARPGAQFSWSGMTDGSSRTISILSPGIRQVYKTNSFLIGTNFVTGTASTNYTICGLVGTGPGTNKYVRLWGVTF